MRRTIPAAVLVMLACTPAAPRPVLSMAPAPRPPETRPVASPADPDPWQRAGVDWSQPPAPGAEPVFAPPTPATFEVDGARVLLIENHRLPLVSIRVVFHRAGAREDGTHAGLASLTAELLTEGAGRFDALTLPEEVERLGAALSAGASADAAVVSVDTLRETFEASLQLVADVIVRPRLERKAFERIKGDRLAELRLRRDHPHEVASLVFEHLIFGAHPYAAPAMGYVDTVRTLTLADVQRFWKTRYHPADATVILVGDVDRATAEQALAKAFAGWRGAPAPAMAVPPAPATRTPVVAVVDRPGAEQSVIIIGRISMTSGDPRFFPSEVINEATGGSFMSRLNGRLREQLGYTYGINSTFWRGRWSGSWMIGGSLKSAHAVDGIREALKIVDELRAQELPAAELEKTIHMMTRSLPQELETNAGIAAAFQEVVIAGLPPDWLEGVIAGIRGVAAARAREVADESWRDLDIVVVGPMAQIRDGLGTLGRPVVVYDEEGRVVSR